MLLDYLGILPHEEVFDVILTAFSLLLVGYGVARLARALFRWVSADENIPIHIRGFIRLAAETSIATIIDRIKDLDVEAQEAEVQAMGRRVYAQMPEVIFIPIRGRMVPIPIKLVITEAVFLEVVMQIFRGVDDIHDALLASLEVEYQYWKDAGSPVPIQPAR
jgi:hypothetical protein